MVSLLQIVFTIILVTSYSAGKTVANSKQTEISTRGENISKEISIDIKQKDLSKRKRGIKSGPPPRWNYYGKRVIKSGPPSRWNYKGKRETSRHNKNTNSPKLKK